MSQSTEREHPSDPRHLKAYLERISVLGLQYFKLEAPAALLVSKHLAPKARFHIDGFGEGLSFDQINKIYASHDPRLDFPPVSVWSELDLQHGYATVYLQFLLCGWLGNYDAEVKAYGVLSWKLYRDGRWKFYKRLIAGKDPQAAVIGGFYRQVRRDSLIPSILHTRIFVIVFSCLVWRPVGAITKGSKVHASFEFVVWLIAKDVEMVGPKLLWIDCDENGPARRREVATAARQHVMLDFIAKQELASRRKAHGARNKQARLLPAGQNHEGAQEEPAIVARKEPTALSLALTYPLDEKGANEWRSSRQAMLAASTLKPSLVLDEDSAMCQAAWWHSHSLNIIFTEPQTGWMGTCRREWGQGFWDLAREDSTLREMFLANAAAKEAVVKSLPHSRPYLVHKGRAMQLVAKDLQKEGKQLRLAAVATMCLLAKGEFIEEEYEAGEAHVRAITAVIGERLNGFPNFLWLFVVWADLRLTGVSSRAPVIPYGLHPDFAEAQLPLHLRGKARFLASCNVISLPSCSIVAAEETALLFQKLHELALAYNSPQETDWRPVWAVTYDAAYMLASMKSKVLSLTAAEHGTPYNTERVVLLTAGIQMWTTVSQFIPVPGFLRYGLEQLSECLSVLEPQKIVDHWTACSGKLDSLLWVFFNASAAAICLCFIGPLSPSSMPRWLWLGLRFITRTMSICSLSSFVEALRPFPYTNDWNERMSSKVWLWLTTGFVIPDDLESEKRRRRAYFTNHRKICNIGIVEGLRRIKWCQWLPPTLLDR